MNQKYLGGIIMELIKKNIHMDQIRCSANTQITLEDDRNVPDNKSDVESIIFNQGSIQIDEVRSGEDRAQISGKLNFKILYNSDEEGRRIDVLEGEIPFQEQIYLENLHNSNALTVDATLEDLSTSLINSRKLSVQSVVSLRVCVDELVDEETSVDIINDDMGTAKIPMEYRKKPMEISELSIQKKDVFCIKEEIQLPSELPNIFEILWQDIDVQITEIKAVDEKLLLTGEIKVFFLYEGEGEEHPIRWYETTIPVNGEIDCHGCKDGFIPEVTTRITHIDVEVRPDFDGEERIIGIELPLELQIKLYEQEHIDIVSDVYGIQNDITAVTKEGHYKNLLIRNNGKFTLNDRMKIDAETGRILQICHSEGSVQVDDMVLKENGIEVQGDVLVKTLYVTNDNESPFASTEGTIPFTYHIDVPDMKEYCEKNVHMQVTDINSTMMDSETIDVKMNIMASAIVFQPLKENIITEIQVNELDPDYRKDLPSIVVYVVKEGDTLWQIGKRYYVSVNQIKEMNGLTSDTIRKGDKLLLVKTITT